MSRDGASLKVCLIAGEPSGDALGASLIHSLRELHSGAIDFIGVGGPQMEQEGLQSLFPMRDLSVMGIAEVLPRLPKILQRLRETAAFIAREQPDVVVTIDAPDFCFRVVRKVRELCASAPVMIHYVAPTVWAWRAERAQKIAKLYDGIMCLFPMEPPYFEREGLEARFVGHPVLEPGCAVSGASLRENLDIPADAPVLGLLFGSRMGEMNRTGPVLHDAAEILTERSPGLHILSLTFPHLRPIVKNLTQGLGKKVHIVTDQALKRDCFAAMNYALATSGTVGLELAVADVPHVIAYKMHPLTAQIVKRKVQVRYAHLANILLDEAVVPEFIQNECRAVAIAERAGGLLEQGVAQRERFAKARSMLAGAGAGTPAQQAARFVLEKAGCAAAERSAPKRAAG